LFDEYIRLHGDRLFRLCLKLCGTRENAEDLYQDTWMAAFGAFGKYDRSQAFEAWLTAICVNRYRDMLRKMKWRRLFPEFATGEEKDAVLANAPAPQEDDSFAGVRDAVDALPEKYRLIVTLYYFEDLDVAKTAAALNIPEGTVKYRLHAAREKLRKELDDIG
jgi:RNA polymerase sigma-70 factor (ECF subfamily)